MLLYAILGVYVVGTSVPKFEASVGVSSCKL